jgi:DNA-binding CsgD family transcriptional regulator
VGTVKKHLQRAYDKLGVSSRSQLLHLAAWRA